MARLVALRQTSQHVLPALSAVLPRIEAFLQRPLLCPDCGTDKFYDCAGCDQGACFLCGDGAWFEEARRGVKGGRQYESKRKRLERGADGDSTETSE